MSRIKIYLKSVIIPVAVGIIIGLLISGSNDYANLEKPFLAPPSIVFPIVWSILYILMGVLYGMLKEKRLVDENIRRIYYGQLVVNAIWPILFFTFKWRFFAFIWIILLAILVVRMVLEFYKKNTVAGLLQLPYLVWTVFATYLNLFVYLLNR